MPFYGFSIDLISQWCGVSKRTARDYKTGIRPVPFCRKIIFELLSQERVLLDPAWAGWRIRGRKLLAPEGFALDAYDVYWTVFTIQHRDSLQRQVDQLKGDLARLGAKNADPGPSGRGVQAATASTPQTTPGEPRRQGSTSCVGLHLDPENHPGFEGRPRA